MSIWTCELKTVLGLSCTDDVEKDDYLILQQIPLQQSQYSWGWTLFKLLRCLNSDRTALRKKTQSRDFSQKNLGHFLFRDLQSIFQDRAQIIPNRGSKPIAREASLVRKATVLQGWKLSTEFWFHVCTASSPFCCVNLKQRQEDNGLLFSLLTAILLTFYICSVDVTLTITILSYSTSSVCNQSSQSSRKVLLSTLWNI